MILKNVSNEGSQTQRYILFDPLYEKFKNIEKTRQMLSLEGIPGRGLRGNSEVLVIFCLLVY